MAAVEELVVECEKDAQTAQHLLTTAPTCEEKKKSLKEAQDVLRDAQSEKVSILRESEKQFSIVHDAAKNGHCVDSNAVRFDTSFYGYDLDGDFDKGVFIF